MNRDCFIKFLSAFELSHSKISRILNALNQNYDFENFYLNDEVESVLGEDYSAIAKKANQKFFDAYLNRLQEKGIGLFTIESEVYPDKLKKIDDAPYYLFYQGDLGLLSLPSVAIVGTRKPSNYGAVITERFAGELAKSGAVVISGLAYGVDSIAHRKALAVGGKTIAVLAGGFDKVYPAEHTSLFEEIVKKGLVLTEHRPDINAVKYNFPQRNRIVAALSDALLITEAGAKSGTTITKDFALDYGVPIYAVPGNITSAQSDGTNNLIASMQGICALNAKQIIDELGLEQKKTTASKLSTNENLIVQCLSNGEKTMDEIEEITKINIAKLNSLLTSHEIKSIIKRMPGGVYSLS